ncbi:hypothetical protein EJ08DRAFT_655836 [Tothia fuscella]|uniref:Uncharacterized protein n=1 Tax=Tothia fuscella TaxID=1048955 RepID=A0A9P4U2U8_9PEZI|nr:hypothetical protein EJ08DRAFT_655836 [Tothia fuscella]
MSPSFLPTFRSRSKDSISISRPMPHIGTIHTVSMMQNVPSREIPGSGSVTGRISADTLNEQNSTITSPIPSTAFHPSHNRGISHFSWDSVGHNIQSNMIKLPVRTPSTPKPRSFRIEKPLSARPTSHQSGSTVTTTARDRLPVLMTRLSGLDSNSNTKEIVIAAGPIDSREKALVRGDLGLFQDVVEYGIEFPKLSISPEIEVVKSKKKGKGVVSRDFTRKLDFLIPSSYPRLEKNPDLRIPLHFGTRHFVEFQPHQNSRMFRESQKCKAEANSNIDACAVYAGLHCCPISSSGERRGEPHFHVIHLFPNGMAFIVNISRIVKLVIALYAFEHFPVRFFLQKRDEKKRHVKFVDQEVVDKVVTSLVDMMQQEFRN